MLKIPLTGNVLANRFINMGTQNESFEYKNIYYVYKNNKSHAKNYSTTYSLADLSQSLSKFFDITLIIIMCNMHSTFNIQHSVLGTQYT